MAAQLGIDEVFAEVLPGQKADVVAKLQQEGAKRVAMVGDGINDAPALARADLGIAIGAGTDVAIESAGVVLASSDPRGVADTITLSRASYRKMLQNLVWATGYNAIGLPLAAGVLAGAGFLHAAGRRGRRDVGVDDRGGAQRAAAAARALRPLRSTRLVGSIWNTRRRPGHSLSDQRRPADRS